MKNRILESGKAKLISDAAFTLFLENVEAMESGRAAERPMRITHLVLSFPS